MKREYKAPAEIKREPTHPGEIFLHDILPALGLSVAEAAAKLRVSRQTLYRITQGSAAVTPEMAVRFGKLCGNGPELWLGLQQQHDLWCARRKLGSKIDRIPTMQEV
ncbi:MAG: HigA family addiction module antitoxin [Candidatus Binataceae bacterium]